MGKDNPPQPCGSEPYGVRAEMIGKPSTLYSVGEAVRAGEVKVRVWKDSKRYTDYQASHTFTANKVPIKQGYRFKESGNKEVRVTTPSGHKINDKLQVRP